MPVDREADVYRDLGVAVLAGLGFMGGEGIVRHAGVWPTGARIVVERGSRLYVVEITDWESPAEDAER